MQKEIYRSLKTQNLHVKLVACPLKASLSPPNASIILDSYTYLLCSKLCWHIIASSLHIGDHIVQLHNVYSIIGICDQILEIHSNGRTWNN